MVVGSGVGSGASRYDGDLVGWLKNRGELRSSICRKRWETKTGGICRRNAAVCLAWIALSQTSSFTGGINPAGVFG